MRQWLTKIQKQWRIEHDRCQSCGMPLMYDKNRLHTVYCSYCHDGRGFRQSLDLRSMREKVKGLLLDRKAPSWIRLYMHWRLATLRRWRRG